MIQLYLKIKVKFEIMNIQEIEYNIYRSYVFCF